jgi:CubicO group peptidase (beta-lactamase class C family)
MNIRRLTFLWIGMLFPLAAGATDADNADAAVRELGRTWLQDNDGIGLSIGVYDHGQRRFYNFGATQLDGDKAPTKDTIYEIGALSKTMTGQLLARAVIEGRASLNDEAEKYMEAPYPNLANGGEKIRLVHLANMTSQLVDNIPDLTQVRAVPGEPLAATHMHVIGNYTSAEFLRQLHRVAPRREPGSDPAQSNVASMLLGVILEKLYDEPFDVILTREIEKPLHMGDGTLPNVKLLAKGYTKDNEVLPGFDARMAYPSASLRYSTSDLLTYAAWQLVERDASVKFAHQPTWSTADRSLSVAMYWIVSTTPQGRRLHYSGGTYGFASVCELYPDAGLAVVLLSNKDADGAQESLRALSAKIVQKYRPEGFSPKPAVAPPAAR